MVNVAIIGKGDWGKNIVRIFYGTPNCNIKFVADLKGSSLGAEKLEEFYEFASLL